MSTVIKGETYNMKLVEKQVINLLNEAMHRRKTHINWDVEWKKIIEEGEANKVEELLY